MNTKIYSLILLITGFITLGCGSDSNATENELVKASCGMCQLGQKDQKGCLTNIVLHGKVLPVVGATKLSMEEMHAPGGLCVTIRKAKVSGKLDGDRFLASKWELLPLEKESPSLPAGH